MHLCHLIYDFTPCLESLQKCAVQYFPPKSLIINGSFVERGLQLKALYASLPIFDVLSCPKSHLFRNESRVSSLLVPSLISSEMNVLYNIFHRRCANMNSERELVNIHLYTYALVCAHIYIYTYIHIYIYIRF